MTGLPVIIVGLIAAIRPETYDMSKTYYEDVMCGSLKLSAEIIRDRLVHTWATLPMYLVLIHRISLLWRFGINVPSVAVRQCLIASFV